MTVERQRPKISALVVADHVYIATITRPSSLSWERAPAIGTAGCPFNCTAPAVYASMIGGRGETPLRLRLFDVNEQCELVPELETTVNFLDPTEEVEIAFHLLDLIFPQPGDYPLQLYRAGQFLRLRRILIIPLENPGNPQPRNTP